MGRSVEILRENLLEHPAVRAWSATEPERVEPTSVAVLKKWSRRHKSGVFRLAGVGPGGSAVIAKRCPLHTAAVERLIYEEFLPRLPLPSLRCYGSVQEPDGQSWWLFLEEACGELYSPHNPEHRALAGRWLAAVHTAGRRHVWKGRLPDRGLAQHLSLLGSCRGKAIEHLNNPSLTPDGAAVLQTVSEQCEILERHRPELEAICREVPRTLIHGDFGVKNLRVRPSADGPELLVYDWEFAGWGEACSDLAQFMSHMASPDLVVYRSCLEDSQKIRDAQVQRWAECGGFFRLVDIFCWTSRGLLYGRPKFLAKVLREFTMYSQCMAGALSEAGWANHD
jgi:hypothetical protein